MDNFSPVLLPVANAGTPLDVILAEKFPTPAICYVKDALNHTFIACGKIHPRSPESPSGQRDMGSYPLVALGPVADPEYGYFLTRHS
jgi:hypothetical protein